jgi:signal transduction histidine kinase
VAIVDRLELQTLRIRRNADVIVARERTRAAALALGLGADDATRIATAASEVARLVLGEGDGELVLAALLAPRPGVVLVFHTARPIRSHQDQSWDALRAAYALADECAQSGERGSHHLELKKYVATSAARSPEAAEIARGRAEAAREALAVVEASESTTAVKAQNRELARLLEEVQRRGRELERVIDELQRANNHATATMLELREVSRRKDELAAAMAHDLRSPLAAVKGAMDLLADGMAGELTEDQQRYTEIARRAAKHVIELVNNLLDSSLVDAGLAHLDPAPLDLREVVEEVSATVGFLAREKGITFEAQIPIELPQLRADRHKLSQILSNLLTNAVKFTEPGGYVTLRAERQSSAMIAVEIADTGVGMSPAQQAMLFDKFHRAHSRGTRGERGTGLGLYLCRQLVELHGGTIQVFSEPGRGTTFRFTTPSLVAAAPQIL